MRTGNKNLHNRDKRIATVENQSDSVAPTLFYASIPYIKDIYLLFIQVLIKHQLYSKNITT